MARLIAQSAVQPGVSTILGQIATSAPGAPDFRIVSMEDWPGVEGPGGETYWEAIPFRVRQGKGLESGEGRARLRLPCMALHEPAQMHSPPTRAPAHISALRSCRRRGGSWGRALRLLAT